MNDSPTPATSPSPKQLPIWLILVVATMAALGAYLGQRFWSPNGADGGFSPISASGQFLRYPQPKDVPPISMQGGDGQPFAIEQLRGRWTLVFFGFTHCPDICPTALATMKGATAQWRNSLSPRQQPQILFVSVDPERDSPAVLGEYVHFFDPQFFAATAAHELLEPWTRALGVVYAKVPTGTQPDQYSVDHSASILLINPQLQVTGILRPPHTVAQLVEDLQPVLSQPLPEPTDRSANR